MYVKVNNGAVEKYPYSASELMADNPQVSFPQNISAALLAEWGVFPVSVTEKPTVDHTKNIAEDFPQLLNDAWTQVWEVTDASAEEIQNRTETKATSVREVRNIEISVCDWTQLPDTPLTTEKKQEWAVYRQELRDITSQPGFPWEVDWPIKPK